MPPRRGSTVSIGNGMPMRPVWQTRTSWAARAPMPRATAPQSRSAASCPGAPVAALALPDVRITPAESPPVPSRWARLTCTGAAAARFEVNTPAAGTARPSTVATRATSNASPALMPPDPPAATNPSGAVTLTGTSPRPEGRWSRAGPALRWRTGSPVPTPPSPGCRAHRGRRPNPSAGPRRAVTCATFEPVVALVDGGSSVTTTKGSSS